MSGYEPFAAYRVCAHAEFVARYELQRVRRGLSRARKPETISRLRRRRDLLTDALLTIWQR